MQKHKSIIKMIFILSTSILINSCTELSKSVFDDKIGENGSFEHFNSGIPINYLVYTNQTVEQGNFHIKPDTIDPKDGKQSLLFDVISCSDNGGRYSPGIAKEIDAIPNSNYKLSFWIKNNQTEFIVKAGGVSPKTGDMETLINTNKDINQWKKLEFEINVKNNDKLRFELNILSKGKLWIDDLNIIELPK